MVKRLVLDPSSAKGEALDHVVQSLSALSDAPKVVVGSDVPLKPGDLLVTTSDDRAQAAADTGATAWRVRSGTGELESWEDLPLAVAFAHGTLDEVRRAVEERRGLKIASLAWTPHGDAVGKTESGDPIFASAGPDGDNPQIFTKGDAESRLKEAGLFAQTLKANDQVSAGGSLALGQTHTLTDGHGRRPILKRNRYSLIPE